MEKSRKAHLLKLQGMQLRPKWKSFDCILSNNKRSTPCKQDYEVALQNSQAEQSEIPEDAQSH